MRIRFLAPIPSVAVVSPVVSVMESVELDSTSGSGMLVSMVGSIMGTVVSVGSVVSAGAVISAEPGIYIPGKLGVRIEDVILLTEDGNINITKAPKELLIL